VVSLARSVVTRVVGFVTIVFLTFHDPRSHGWVERGLGALPAAARPRWRHVGRQIGRTISGYATGDLLLSLIAGVASAVVLAIAGVPFPVALGLLVAILDLVPLAGATLAGIILAVVAS
jgi:predicted PurR-regulated permease PerM